MVQISTLKRWPWIPRVLIFLHQKDRIRLHWKNTRDTGGHVVPGVLEYILLLKMLVFAEKKRASRQEMIAHLHLRDGPHCFFDG